MKKFLALIAALVMVFAVSATAFAAADQVHNGTLPYTNEEGVAKITINGLHTGGSDDGTNLPSEYHVRVKWNITNGVYNATATDVEGGFQNFSWDCETLQYKVNTVTGGTSDTREGNWATNAKPAVAFEVTNASTPDLSIQVAASLKGANAWAGLLKAATIETQNDTTIGTQTVAPVLRSNMGTGRNSYEQDLGAGSHNVYAYTYILNWDYDALNAKALANYKAGTGTQELTNTFVVTVSAAGN